MDNIFAKFDKQFDVETLKNDIKKIRESGGGNTGYKEVPNGTYEVKVAKIEGKVSKSSDNPIISTQFKILQGDYKGSSFFITHMLTQDWNIEQAEKYLASLNPDIDTTFTGYADFNNVILDVGETMDNFEYVAELSETKGGFKIVKIMELFDVE